MAKAELKTKPTEVDPIDFIEALGHDKRRNDAKALLEFFCRLTGMVPTIWGPSIIGYGRYAYSYESGREGAFKMTGFSPRKANLVIYIMPGYRGMSEKPERLGKHRLGKACLYINKLADIDLAVLEDMITESLASLRATHRTYDI